jgi:hypothetical protein
MSVGKNIRREKTSGGQNVWGKKHPVGQNVQWDKTSGGTKRPKVQNIRRQNDRRDKTFVGTKHPRGKRKCPARKKALSFDQWEKISYYVRGKKHPAGEKNAWQGKKSPLSKPT